MQERTSPRGLTYSSAGRSQVLSARETVGDHELTPSQPRLTIDVRQDAGMAASAAGRSRTLDIRAAVVVVEAAASFVMGYEGASSAWRHDAIERSTWKNSRLSRFDIR